MINGEHSNLVGAVEQSENVTLLHGDLTWTLLLIVVQSKNQLLTSLIVSWGHLLLLTDPKQKSDAIER